MFRTHLQAEAETVPLHSAVLCVDCEMVSNTRRDECPVCGSHSLLGLAGMIGGTLLDCRANRLEKQRFVLFDLHITIELTQMEGRELNAAIERITGIIGPKLGRGGASLHVNVEPVGTRHRAEMAEAA